LREAMLTKAYEISWDQMLESDFEAEENLKLSFLQSDW
jgi:hypothetical protein